MHPRRTSRQLWRCRASSILRPEAGQTRSVDLWAPPLRAHPRQGYCSTAGRVCAAPRSLLPFLRARATLAPRPEVPLMRAPSGGGPTHPSLRRWLRPFDGLLHLLKGDITHRVRQLHATGPIVGGALPVPMVACAARTPQSHSTRSTTCPRDARASGPPLLSRRCSLLEVDDPGPSWSIYAPVAMLL